MASKAANPFKIHVADAVLDDLRLRLDHPRFTRVTNGPARGSSWEQGTSPAYLQRLVRYWRERYDWRRHEARLNEQPQYTAEVDGERLHFVHVTGQGPRPTPLLLLHGWPDSFHRFHKVTLDLADPRRTTGNPHDAYDVVVPSLPGFAFTGPLRRPSAHQPSRHSAHLIWRLMTDVLGYQRFAVAGGDGGSVLAQILAIDHPDNVIGIHLTDLGWHATSVDETSVSKVEQKYLKASKKRFLADGAYAMVQTTRPRSLAAALNDSPVGLASWIVDRFHAWSDRRGGRQMSVSPDDLLTNIMLYWATQTIGASMFQYYAEARSPSLTPADRVTVPVGMALFPKDIGGVPPRRLAERTLNVQRWTEMARGGHFAALEEPALFFRDVMEFFRPLVTAEQPAIGPRRTEHVAPRL